MRDHGRLLRLRVAGLVGLPAASATAEDSGDVRLGNYLVPVVPVAERKMHGRVTVGVRPENWRVVLDDPGGLPLSVTVVKELGSGSFVYGTSDVKGVPSNVVVRVGRVHPHRGETLYVAADIEHAHVFDTETGERLSE